MVALAGRVWWCVEYHDEWDIDSTLAHLDIGHGCTEYRAINRRLERPDPE